MSAAVFDTSGIVSWSGWGLAKMSGAKPTRKTIYRIASMSKSFLAAAALQLQERHLLSLQDSLSHALPEFRDKFHLDTCADDHSLADQITLEMLLSNRSGLPEDNPWVDDNLDIPVSDFLALVSDKGLRLTFPPNMLYQYSNIGMSLVGRALERVTGQPIEQYIKENIFIPLGLTNTSYTVPVSKTSHIAHGYLSFDSQLTWEEVPFIEGGALGCIGSIFSTPDDIARWSQFLSSAFHEQDSVMNKRWATVLSAQSRREMQRIHTPIHSSDDRLLSRDLDNTGYGMGLIVEQDHRLGRIVQHSGGLPGFSSNMRWHARSQIGTVVFANTAEYPAAETAAYILSEVCGSIGVPAEAIQLWPETEAAVAAFDHAIRARKGLGSTPVPVARNLFRNRPLEVRQQELQKLVDELGGIDPFQPELSQRWISADSSACARWAIWCRSGTLVGEVNLLSIAPHPVQALRICKANSHDALQNRLPHLMDHAHVITTQVV
ncbi:serine hydrolase domain-containing protein [Pseudoclavibacter sp. CFCC 13796]|uniref:serine hydrolase domain-containing protein n=1 Tax=Pseudoclavibacter sp. CFCC 13796 TaxID=2615179 RepID=UPI001787F0A6|nr:serine hydrolase domain-containing protein [Pseudoclavibacter sp. CFCC 13796]